jgi:ABC-type lipopolysaccharide export system ATPase subunit
LSFIAERRKKEKGSSPLQDEPEEDVLDEETQALDAVAVERIKQIINEYQDEMNNFELKKEGGEVGLVRSILIFF